MNISLIASISINGRIFTNPLNSDFKPPQYFLDYVSELTRSSKNLIIGRKLFESSKESWLNLTPDIEIIVISTRLEDSHSAYKVVQSPQKALEYIKAKEHDSGLVVGGIQTYQGMMATDQVSDLYLDIAPIINTKGDELTLEKDYFKVYKQMSCQQLDSGMLRVHLSL